MDKLEYIPGDLVMTNGVPLGTAQNVVYRVTSSDPSKTLKLDDGTVIKPQVVKLHSRVTMSNFEMQYYCRDKFGMEQLKRRAIESVYDEILKGMKANGLVPISQYKDIYTNSTIYEGTCEIYKKTSSYEEGNI